MQIFISVQRIRNERQELILQTVRDRLEQARATSLILNRDATDTFTDPMPRIREALASCRAAVIIAFARVEASTVTEYPGDSYAIAHQSQHYCSVWNQIEAAMAFQAGLPLLVFQDDDLFQQGAINVRRISYPVIKLSLDNDAPALRLHITQSIDPWLGELLAHEPE